MEEMTPVNLLYMKSALLNNDYNLNKVILLPDASRFGNPRCTIQCPSSFRI